MYLETILILSKTGKAVRAIDIAEYMGYSKPSVSRAVGLLKKGGYVEADEHGHLLLTAAGKASAEKTYDRHQVLTDFFIRLGVNEKTAAEDACRIEHILSEEAFAALKKHLY